MGDDQETRGVQENDESIEKKLQQFYKIFLIPQHAKGVSSFLAV